MEYELPFALYDFDFIRLSLLSAKIHTSVKRLCKHSYDVSRLFLFVCPFLQLFVLFSQRLIRLHRLQAALILQEKRHRSKSVSPRCKIYRAFFGLSGKPASGSRLQA